MRFADELRGSEGEACQVKLPFEVTRDAVICAVYDEGRRVFVQFDDDLSRREVSYELVTLYGEEN